MSLLTDLPGEDLSPPILASDQVVIVRGGRTYLGDANLTWPGSAAASVTQPDTGAVARSVTGKVLETLSVWDFWVAPATDATAMLRLFAAAGRSGIIPAGDYVVSGQIDWPSLGQVIRGEGRTKTRILINSPPAGAQAIFNVLAGEPSTQFEDIGFYFAQPDTNVRANLNVYPPAIQYNAAPRGRVSRIRTQRGTRGVVLVGNCGGFTSQGHESSCFVTNMEMDGCLDSVRIQAPHFWPFGLTTNQQQIFYDDSCYGVHSGRCDDLKISDGIVFAGRAFRFYRSASGSTFGTITGQDFDNFGGLFVEAGNIVVSGFVTTLGNTSKRHITQSGGVLTLAAPYIRTDAVPLNGSCISLTGGHLNLAGGTIDSRNADSRALLVQGSAATFDVVGTSILLDPARDYSSAQIYIADCAGGTVAGVSATPPTTGSGSFAAVAADRAVVFNGNRHSGRGIDIGGNYLLPLFLDNYSGGTRDFIGSFGSGPVRRKRFTGTADASGNYSVAHGIANADQRLLGVQAYCKSASGTAQPITLTSVTDTTATFSGAVASSPVRILISYSDELHAW